MENKSGIDMVKDLADTIKRSNDKIDDMFFNRLESIEKKELGKMLYGFSKVINEWSKILAKLVSRLDDSEDRIIIMKNLIDEHGNGNIENSHVNTYKRFINNLCKESEMNEKDKKRNYGVNDDFISFLKIIVSKLSTVEHACFVLGMIEYCYIDISKYFNEYLKKRGITVEHYTEHEILDVEHANDLFEVGLRQMNRNGYNYDCDGLENSLIKGYNLIYGYYNSLI